MVLFSGFFSPPSLIEVLHEIAVPPRDPPSEWMLFTIKPLPRSLTPLRSFTNTFPYHSHCITVVRTRSFSHKPPKRGRILHQLPDDSFTIRPPYHDSRCLSFRHFVSSLAPWGPHPAHYALSEGKSSLACSSTL